VSHPGLPLRAVPTATILITDLVGSTASRTRLGEEAADRLHRLHERLLRVAVETHGGVVVKGLGDGILAGFGAAAEAVTAAVAIQQAADLHSRRHPDQALSVRVGVSAGDITIEEDGDHVGTPVIEAARLCAAAAGGQILVADLVRALARGRGGHTFSEVGDLELKGLSEPVAALEVAWKPERSAGLDVSFPPLLGASGRFAGRATELVRVEAAWKEAVAGTRRAVLVAGEPGVGKTRLAAESARRVHDAGGTVLYGRCEEDLGVPYEPFVEALRWFCEHVPAEELASRLGRYPGELARLVPELTSIVGGLDPPLRSDPETEQYRFFEAVASWLTSAGEPGGLLLVVDDLHWAPPPTIALLAHVLRAGAPAPLLVLATFRDTDVGADHPLIRVLGDWRRIPGIDRLTLDGLSVDELTQLLEGLPRSQAARALAVALHETTEGNPFFVGEVLRNVSESGPGPATLPVPEGVRDVVVARIARLDPATRQLIGVAAVLGRNFDLALLAAVAGVDQEDAVRSLDQALDARLVEETDVGAYRFVHALVRSALYETLSATRRAQLHLAAADVLEHPTRSDPARLAHHLLAATTLAAPGRTADACLAAGDQALAVLADAEAATWYSQGLSFAVDDPLLRIDLLTGLGEAQRRTGDPTWRELLLSAARLSAAQRDTVHLVRAVLANSRGFTSVIGHVDHERLELIQTALDLVGSAPSAERAELLALHASELLFTGEHRQVLRVADEATTIAARLDDVSLSARVGMRRLLACHMPERVTALVHEGADVVAFADRTGDPHVRVISRGMWAFALEAIGDLQRARAVMAEAMAIADDTGQPGLRGFAHFVYAGVVDAVGEHQEVERLTQTGFELVQQAGWPDAIMWYGGPLLPGWTFEGQAETATVAAAQASASFPAMVAWQGVRAFGLALTGRKEELAALLADLPPIPVDFFWLETQYLFAVAQGFGVQNRDAAAATYDALLPYRDLHVAYALGYWGPVEVALAVAARVAGDVEGALVHHQMAAATIDACGAARARALNGHQWAKSLLCRDAPGDREQARRLAEDTLAYCRQKGYSTFVAKTEELLAAIP
jgi:class 3 adenylate cyclase